MQYWVFRNSYDGFFDWLGSIRKIKLRYHMLCANRGTGLIEFHFDEFIETKNVYMQYPILISGGLSLIPIDKCFKGSAIVFVSTLFSFGLNGFLNYLLGGVTNCYQVSFVDWNNYSNGNVALIVAVVGFMASFVLLIFGIVNYKKSKKHISTLFH